MSQEIVEKTFDVATPPKLTLSNIRGSVEIQTGADNTILVSALLHQRSGDFESTKIEMTQLDANHVSVRTDFQVGWLGFLKHKPCKVEYTIQVPKGCSLSVSGVSSSIAIQGNESDMQLKSVNGQITLQDVSGLIKINSVSGNVFGCRVVGSLDINTVSGKVRFEESQLSSVAGQTISGNITLHSPLIKGPFQFDSVSGDVEMLVPGDTSFTAIINSLSGRLSAAFPTTNNQANGGYRQLEIHGGGIEVRLKSVSGSLHMKPFNDAIPKEGNIPILSQSGERSTIPNISNTPSTENYMGVLERINKGELSVDEAIEIIS